MRAVRAHVLRRGRGGARRARRVPQRRGIPCGAKKIELLRHNLGGGALAAAPPADPRRPSPPPPRSAASRPRRRAGRGAGRGGLGSSPAVARCTTFLPARRAAERGAHTPWRAGEFAVGERVVMGRRGGRFFVLLEGAADVLATNEEHQGARSRRQSTSAEFEAWKASFGKSYCRRARTRHANWANAALGRRADGLFTAPSAGRSPPGPTPPRPSASPRRG